MEQKRVLWIIAAVGVFLLVVLGGALIIYSPATYSPKSIAKTDSVKDSDGWISLAPSTEKKTIDLQEEPVLNFSKDNQVTKVGELTVYADNATVVNGNPQQAALNVMPGVNPFEHKEQTSVNPAPEYVKAENQTVAPQNIYNTTTIEIAAVTEQVSPVKPRNEKTLRDLERAEQNGRKETKPVVSQTPAKTETAKKPVVASAAKPAAKPAVKPETAKTSVKPASSAPKMSTQYWIQVASLTSRKNADTARETLGENKITADVFTYKDNSDKLYYRVRVGPYTTKSEAEYWRTEIAKIDSFANSSSYVTSTVSN